MNQLFGADAYGAKAGAVYSASVVFYVTVSLIGGIVTGSFAVSGDPAAYIGFACSPVALALVFVLCPKVFNIPPAQAAPLKCRPRFFIASALAAFGCLFALSPLNSLFVDGVRALGYEGAASAMPSFSGWGMAAGLVFAALLPAVCEELIFRGCILANARSAAGGVPAIFISAFLFALYHGSIQQTLYQFACGCIFALIALRSGSVLPSMLAHFLNNAAIVVLGGLGLLDASGNLAAPDWVFVLLVSLCALALAGSLAFLVKGFKPVGAAGARSATGSLFAWASAGIFLMSLIWVLDLFSL